MACSASSSPNNPNEYKVKRIKEVIYITGKGESPHWKQANVLSDFVYPWRDEATSRTEFRALWNGSHIFFLYQVEDPDIITHRGESIERNATRSDRVEIFFKADDQMNPYYSLEMDADGRYLDAEARTYRQIDSEWDWPEGHLEIKAWKGKNTYRVEGAISLESLRELGMYKDDYRLLAGLYRGEYARQSDGTILTKWISWIRPNSEKPDFHIPSSFGTLILEP